LIERSQRHFAEARDLLARMLRWRVGLRWLLVTLLTAPILMAGIIFSLSLTSPTFVPAIVTTDDRMGLVMSGIMLGLTVSFFEEIGWTGFVTPELGKRHGIVPTGLLMGVVWGAWHYPLFSGSASGTIAPALSIAVLLFTFLIPFRILMVWLHDRTRSVLVVMFMHAPLAAGQLILLPSALSNEGAVIFDLVFAAALWGLVAAVCLASGREKRGELASFGEASRLRPWR
jgi:membrane protease YdiL (CAAX protease family)